jgi:hypothetical protein
VETSFFKPAVLLPPSDKDFLDQASLDELRASVAPRIYIFVFVIGLGISIFVQDLSGLIAPRFLALLLMVTPLAAWAAQLQSYRLGMWILMAGSFLTILIAQFAYPSSIVAIGLIALVAMSGLCISNWAGLMIALISTMTIAVLAVQHLLPPGRDFAVVVLVLIWAMHLLCWVAIDPLNTLVQWVLYYFTQANNRAATAAERSPQGGSPG